MNDVDRLRREKQPTEHSRVDQGEITIHILNGQPTFTISPIESPQALNSKKLTRQRPWFQVLVFGITLALPSSVSAFFSPAEVIAKTNAVRVQHGRHQLTAEPRLMHAATLKANDMVGKHYFGHTSPTGQSPWSWFSKVGYEFTEVGENLAKDFVASEDLLQAWLVSPAHRNNLLGSQYADVGVGIASGSIDGRETTVVVQFFGSRTALTESPVAQAPMRRAAPLPPTIPDPILTIPSLVHPQGAQNPTLNFTLQEPDVALLGPRPLSPQVQGIQSQNLSTATPQNLVQLQRDLPILMLIVMLIQLLTLSIFGLLRTEKPKNQGQNQLELAPILAKQ